MEHAIGKKITLEVVEGKTCESCFFERGGVCALSNNLECVADFRTDHKNIIYKEIEED